MKKVKRGGINENIRNNNEPCMGMVKKQKQNKKEGESMTVYIPVGLIAGAYKLWKKYK